MNEEKSSADVLAQAFGEQMIENLRRNVADEKARRSGGCVERPVLEVDHDGALRMSDDEKDYPMNGPCCQ